MPDDCVADRGVSWWINQGCDRQNRKYQQQQWDVPLRKYWFKYRHHSSLRLQSGQHWPHHHQHARGLSESGDANSIGDIGSKATIATIGNDGQGSSLGSVTVMFSSSVTATWTVTTYSMVLIRSEEAWLQPKQATAAMDGMPASAAVVVRKLVSKPSDEPHHRQL